MQSSLIRDSLVLVSSKHFPCAPGSCWSLRSRPLSWTQAKDGGAQAICSARRGATSTDTGFPSHCYPQNAGERPLLSPEGERGWCLLSKFCSSCWEGGRRGLVSSSVGLPVLLELLGSLQILETSVVSSPDRREKMGPRTHLGMAVAGTLGHQPPHLAPTPAGPGCGCTGNPPGPQPHCGPSGIHMLRHQSLWLSAHITGRPIGHEKRLL